jgi:stage V sporulation protein G
VGNDKEEENSMLITDVRMRKVSTQSQLKAVASITISDEFVVHDIKVIEGEKGLFVAMPSRKSSDGEFRDIAHPLNSQTREYIQKLILDKYQTMLKEEESAAALETA